MGPIYRNIFKPRKRNSAWIMKKIPIYHKGKLIDYLIVDNCDYGIVSSRRWHLVNSYSDRVSTTEYMGKIDGKYRSRHITIHRFLLNAPKEMSIDHIDGNGFNNQRANLRICTQRENNRNTRKRSGTTSKYKGVSFYKHINKWCSEIKTESKKEFLGYFNNEKDAAMAYNKRAKEVFKDFARLNTLK